MSLREILKQPFPYDARRLHKWKVAAFFSAFVFIFLLLFKPFELSELTTEYLWLMSAVYGAVTFTCVFAASSLLPILYPKVFDERTWTVGKQIFFITVTIVLVGVCNYLVSPLFLDTSLSLSNALWFQFVTVSVALIPVIIFVLIQQNFLLRRFRSEAAEIEKKLQEKNEVTPRSELNDSSKKKIHFEGDYQNERIEIYPDDLYLVTTANNYIKIFHLQKDKLIYSIIRSTLKKAEEALTPYHNFFKCHRAYIINLDKVEHVEGNAQGYKLRIKDFDELVPVSRNLNEEFSDRLLAFRKIYSDA